MEEQDSSRTAAPSEPGGDGASEHNCYFECRSAAELNRIFSGELPRRLKRFEKVFRVTAVSRDNWIRFSGVSPFPEQAVSAAEQLRNFLEKTGSMPSDRDLELILDSCSRHSGESLQAFFSARIPVSSGKPAIVPRTRNQLAYVKALAEADIVLAAGPAGTGKTYLAVAQAVSALLAGTVERIILARPAVEAGENLGFLPGNLEEKINPYLRPLHDALREMLSPTELETLTSKGMIELAPLAFMRGRTLNNAFIILDEAQNATRDQMVMFLTRLGYRSKCVAAGDPTQTDLPYRNPSGFPEALHILDGIDGIRICRFGREDVLRHTLVERVIHAYETAGRTAEKKEETV